MKYILKYLTIKKLGFYSSKQIKNNILKILNKKIRVIFLQYYYFYIFYLFKKKIKLSFYY